MPFSARIALAMFAAASPMAAQSRAIDGGRSTITIHVGKAGLLSAAGHDHTISAPIASGTLSETAPAHVEFIVETAKMTVQANPKVDAKTQATIQADMQNMTLESQKYPEIRFRSTKAERLAGENWKVEGELTLHGATKPVSVTVSRNGDAFVTHAKLRQTDFGIKPISIGGGVIRVKNELELDFVIVPAKG